MCRQSLNRGTDTEHVSVDSSFCPRRPSRIYTSQVDYKPSHSYFVQPIFFIEFRHFVNQNILPFIIYSEFFATVLRNIRVTVFYLDYLLCITFPII